MSINTVTTDDLRQMNGKEGLVLQGCGGDPQEWLDGINQILGTDNIGSGGFGLVGFLALSQNGDTDGFARTVRQSTNAANHLIGMFRIDTEVDGNVDGFVKFGGSVGFDDFDSLFQRIGLRLVNCFVCVYNSFSSHRLTPLP